MSDSQHPHGELDSQADSPAGPHGDLARHDLDGSSSVIATTNQYTGTLPERFENPGLPQHIHRAADVDENAARRAELQVTALFGVSMLATLVFLVCYFVIPLDKYQFLPGIGQANVQNIVLGLTLTVALLGIGVGAVHWAKTLMPDEEVVEERHPLRSAPQDRQDFVEALSDGADSAQLARRPMIKYALGGALGLFALPLVLQVGGSLGPVPHNELGETFWKKGMRLVLDPDLTPVKAEDVTDGSVFHVLPEGINKVSDELEQKGKAAVLLIRLDPDLIHSQKERDWGWNGIVAYSMICTHVGCPVGLYEQTTHHLLCPCHQSTFDVTQDCKVIFGPAGHPLPQLPITVDSAGYLVSVSGFHEPVGPSYWERS